MTTTVSFRLPSGPEKDGMTTEIRKSLERFSGYMGYAPDAHVVTTDDKIQRFVVDIALDSTGHHRDPLEVHEWKPFFDYLPDPISEKILACFLNFSKGTLDVLVEECTKISREELDTAFAAKTLLQAFAPSSFHLAVACARLEVYIPFSSRVKWILQALNACDQESALILSKNLHYSSFSRKFHRKCMEAQSLASYTELFIQRQGSFFEDLFSRSSRPGDKKEIIYTPLKETDPLFVDHAPREMRLADARRFSEELEEALQKLEHGSEVPVTPLDESVISTLRRKADHAGKIFSRTTRDLEHEVSRMEATAIQLSEIIDRLLEDENIDVLNNIQVEPVSLTAEQSVKLERLLSRHRDGR